MRIRIIIQKIKKNADLLESQHEAEIYRDYIFDENDKFEVEKWGFIVNDMIETVKDKKEIS
jgi:hypothetical protein